MDDLQYINKFAKMVDVDDVPQEDAERYKRHVEGRNRQKTKHIPNAPVIGFTPGGIKMAPASDQVTSGRIDTVVRRSLAMPSQTESMQGSSLRAKHKKTIERTLSVNI